MTEISGRNSVELYMKFKLNKASMKKMFKTEALKHHNLFFLQDNITFFDFSRNPEWA